MGHCKKCIAKTQTGILCKRYASCKIGCNYYCWQHAKNKVKKRCVDKKIYKCGSCKKLKTQKYPCVKKKTVFHQEDEMAEFCQLRKHPKGEYRRSERKRIAVQASSKIQTPVKRKSIKRVSFN
uniref:Uncharacterized protein n=1 Tax=Marseillevirus LCMAC102 TaxID=2506603 RepID=A0A481YTA8_9VIRU|nr:MAG: hypothetical protein LCMAC102_03280 [Marseillevirus LCMAC102]